MSTFQDVARIQDEDLLRRMWQETEDFDRKKEIRSRMYRLREERLKNLHSNHETMEMNQTKESNGHADSLADHSFIGLKSKEIRDASSPTREIHYKIDMSDIPASQHNKGWNVVTKNETSNDGKTHTTSKLATTAGSTKIDKGVANYAAKCEDKSSVFQDGDANNFTKSTGSSTNSAITQEASGGDENSKFHTTSSKTSSSSKFASESRNRNEDVNGNLKSLPSVDISYTEPHFVDANTKVITQVQNLPDGSKVTKTRYETTGGQSTTSSTTQSSSSQKVSSSSTKSSNHVESHNNAFDNSQTHQIPSGETIIRTTRTVQEVVPNFVDENTHVSTESHILPDGTRVNKTKYETVSGKSTTTGSSSTHSSTSQKIASEQRSSSTKASASNVQQTSNVQSSDYQNVPQNRNYPSDLPKDLPPEFFEKDTKITTETRVLPDGTKVTKTKWVGAERPVDAITKQPIGGHVAPEQLIPVDTTGSTTHVTKSTKQSVSQKSSTATKHASDHQTMQDSVTSKHVEIHRNEHVPKNDISPVVPYQYDQTVSTVVKGGRDTQVKQQSHHTQHSSHQTQGKHISNKSTHQDTRRTTHDEFPRTSTITTTKTTYVENQPIEFVVPVDHQSSTTKVYTDKKQSSTNLINEERQHVKDTQKQFHVTETPNKRRPSDAESTTSTTSKYSTDHVNTKISVEVSPTHDAFARSLRSVTPDRERRSESVKSVRSTTSSVRSSISPEKHHVRPTKTPDRFSSTETVTKTTRRVSPAKTPTSPTKKYPSQPDGSISPSTVSTDFEYIKTTDLDETDIRRAPGDRPLKRRDTYEERCRQILGIPEGKNKSPEKQPIKEFPSQVRKSPEKQPLIKPTGKAQPTKDKPKIGEFPSQIRRTPEKQPFEKPTERTKPVKESPKIGEYPSQIRRSPEKEPLEVPVGKTRPVKESPKIQEYPSQIRRTPDREPLDVPPEKSKPAKEQPKIGEYPSQVRRTSEREPLEKPEERPQRPKDGPKIQEFPSQIRKSPERQPFEKPQEKERPVKTAPGLSEYPHQVRKSPEKEEAPQYPKYVPQTNTSPERRMPIDEPVFTKTFIDNLCREDEVERTHINKILPHTTEMPTNDNIRPSTIIKKDSPERHFIHTERKDTDITIKEYTPQKPGDESTDTESEHEEVETVTRTTVSKTSTPSEKITLDDVDHTTHVDENVHIRTNRVDDLVTKKKVSTTPTRKPVTEYPSQKKPTPQKTTPVTSKVTPTKPSTTKTRPTVKQTVTQTTTVQKKTTETKPQTRHQVTATINVTPKTKPIAKPTPETATKVTQKKITRTTSDQVIKPTPTHKAPVRGQSKPELLPSTKEPNKVVTTKSILINNDTDDRREVIVNLQRSKSSREPSPDHVYPLPASDDEDYGVERYPDEIVEPDEQRRRKPIRMPSMPVIESEDIEIEEEITRQKINRVEDTDECLLSVDQKVKKFGKDTKDVVSKPRPEIVIDEDENYVSVSDKVSKFISTAEQLTHPQQGPDRPKSPVFRTTDKPRVDSPQYRKPTKSDTPKGVVPTECVEIETEEDTYTRRVETKESPRTYKDTSPKESPRSVLSPTGRLRSNESIRKAKEIFENISSPRTPETKPTATRPVNKKLDYPSDEEEDSPKTKTPHYRTPLDRNPRTHSPQHKPEHHVDDHTKHPHRPHDENLENKPHYMWPLDRTPREHERHNKEELVHILETEEIEEIFDLELLEELMEVATSYEQRRIIRTQIKIVEQMISEGKLHPRGKSPEKPKSKQRVYTDEELIHIWETQQIEEVYDMEVLEELLEIAETTEQRRKIRMQIRVVEELIQENKLRSVLSKRTSPARSKSPEKPTKAKPLKHTKEELLHILETRIVEEIYDLETLEELMEVAVSYEQRRQIRTQIRVVEQLIEEDKLHTVTTTRTTKPTNAKTKKPAKHTKTDLLKILETQEIEEIYDLETLEELLEVVVASEQRRRIRTQIRVVEELIAEDKLHTVTTKTVTTIRSTVPEKRVCPKYDDAVKPVTTTQRRHDETKKTTTVTTAATMKSPKKTNRADLLKILETQDIEQIYSLEILEELLEVAVSYDQRRKIRNQIRVVKQLIAENKLHTITSKKVTKSPSRGASPEKQSMVTEYTTEYTRQVSPPRKVAPKKEVHSAYQYQETHSSKTAEKPIWVTQRNLKKSSDRPNPSKTMTSTTTTTRKETTRKSPSKETDIITSSYGVGPTDENGTPLFGLKALRSQNRNETSKTSGTVIESHYYSENGEEPVGEVTVTKYSTDPNDFQRTSGVEKRNGVMSVTTTKKVKGTPATKNIQKITDIDIDEDETTTMTKTMKFTRRGSVKEMSKKFIDNAVETSKNERNTYPKAGLILRTTGIKNGTAEKESPAVQQEVTKTTTTVRRTSKTGTNDNFLNNYSRVKGVQDVITRMKNSDTEVREGESLEDTEARNLLNKFIGSQVLLSGMEGGGVPSKTVKKTTTTTSVSKGDSKPRTITRTFTHPITHKDLETVTDEETLKLLLERCTEFEERRLVRNKLRQVMAEQEVRAHATRDSSARVEGESLLLPLLQGLLDAPPELEQTADSGTESGEDLRNGLVAEVQNALTKLAASLKGGSTDISPDRRSSLLQLVDKLQAGLGSQPPTATHNQRRGAGRFCRRKRHNRHTVGVSSEELEDARRLMEEIALHESINVGESNTIRPRQLQKQLSECLPLRDSQSPDGLNENKTHSAKPSESSSNISRSQSGTSSAMDTPTDASEVPEKKDNRGEPNHSTSTSSTISKKSSQGTAQDETSEEEEEVDEEEVDEEEEDEEEDEEEEIVEETGSEGAEEEEEEVEEETEEEEETLTVKPAPPLKQSQTPAKQSKPVQAKELLEQTAKPNVVLQSNPLYTPNGHDNQLDLDALNRYNAKKLKMKRANTIDIPKPLEFYESEDEYEGDVNAGVAQETNNNHYPNDQNNVQIKPPPFQPKNDSDRKFVAFLNQHNQNSSCNRTIWNNPKMAADTNDSNWSNKFGNIKTAFEQKAATFAQQPPPPKSVKSFWKSSDDAVAAGKQSYNGPKVSKQGARNLQQMFEQRTQQPSSTDQNVVTGSLRIDTKSVEMNKPSRFVPQPINKFSHAPTSAFAPIPRKATPTQESPPPHVRFYHSPTHDDQHRQQPSLEPQVHHTPPISPPSPSHQQTHLIPPPTNTLKKDVLEVDSLTGSPLFLYSPKQVTNSPQESPTSPSSTPWACAMNANEHRVQSIASSKFENYMPKEPVRIVPHKLDKEKIKEPQYTPTAKLLAPILTKSADKGTSVRKLSDQFDTINAKIAENNTYFPVKHVRAPRLPEYVEHITNPGMNYAQESPRAQQYYQSQFRTPQVPAKPMAHIIPVDDKEVHRNFAKARSPKPLKSFEEPPSNNQVKQKTVPQVVPLVSRPVMEKHVEPPKAKPIVEAVSHRQEPLRNQVKVKEEVLPVKRTVPKHQEPTTVRRMSEENHSQAATYYQEPPKSFVKDTVTQPKRNIVPESPKIYPKEKPVSTVSPSVRETRVEPPKARTTVQDRPQPYEATRKSQPKEKVPPVSKTSISRHQEPTKTTRVEKTQSRRVHEVVKTPIRPQAPMEVPKRTESSARKVQETAARKVERQRSDRPKFQRQTSTESIHEYEAAVAKVMTGPTSHQAITIQTKAPKKREEHEVVETKFNIKQTLQKFAQMEKSSNKVPSPLRLDGERKLSVDSNTHHRKPFAVASVQRSSSLKKSAPAPTQQRAFNGKTEPNTEGPVTVFHIPLATADDAPLPKPPSVLSRSDSWQKFIMQRQQQDQARQAPTSKPVVRSKSSHSLAVPTLQFQAGMTQDEIAQKKNTVASYFTGGTTKSPETTRGGISRKRTSEKITIHSHSHSQGVIRSRTLPNIVCPNLLDESQVEESFEHLFKATV